MAEENKAAQESKSEQQHRRMLTTPMPKLIASLAAPTVAAMLVTVIYNTADTFFVSRINKSASAGVGAVYAVMAIIQATGGGFGMGSGSIISRKLGEKKNEEADMYVSSAFFGAFALAVVIAALGLTFLTPLMRALGCSETMLPYSKPYAMWIFLGAPIQCTTFILNNSLRSQGKSALAMWGTMSGGLLNIALDPLFIFTFGLGTAGAAIATVLSQCVSFMILLSCYLRGKTILHISLKNVSRDIRDYGLILATGIPTIFRQSLGSIASAAVNIQAVVYGDAAVAAITISNKVYMLVRNVVLGIGQGFQPAAGYNFGAGNKKRTRQAFEVATLFGTVTCVVCAAVIAIFAEKIMWWFCADEEVVVLGTAALRYGCIVMPLLAFSTYVNQLYQSLGFKFSATILASCRQGIFFLPAVNILPRLLAVRGVQLAQPAADLLTFVVSCPFLVMFYRRHLSETPADKK